MVALFNPRAAEAPEPDAYPMRAPIGAALAAVEAAVEEAQGVDTLIDMRAEGRALPSPPRRMVRRALDLRGTPYCHRGRTPGLALDWLGLVRACVGAATERRLTDLATYGPADVSTDAAAELFLAWGLTEIDPAEMFDGDVLLFGVGDHAHAGVLTTWARPELGRWVHAYWGHGVTESWLGQWWRERLVRVFTAAPISRGPAASDTVIVHEGRAA